MAQQQFYISSFNLSSTWKGYNQGSGPYYSTPSTGSATKSFDVSGIPANATIISATLTATLGSPYTGADFKRVNGTSWSGTYDALSVLQSLNGNYADGASFTFTFRANGEQGTVSSAGTSHSSSLGHDDVTLDVTYTPPYTPPTVSNVLLDGLGSDQYRSPGTNVSLSWVGADGAYNPIQSYSIERSENGGAYTPLVSGLTVTSYTVTAHAAGGCSYQYRVAALGVYFGGADVSPKLLSYTAPSVSGVKINGSTLSQYKAPSSSIPLAWTGTAGTFNDIARYAIYRSVNGGAYSQLTEVTGVSYLVAAPSSVNEHYQYCVIAVGERSNSGAAYSPGLDTFTNPSVSNVTLAGSASDQFRAPGAAVTLSWTGTNGVNNAIRSYNVYFSVNGGGFSPLVSGMTGSNCSVSAHTLGGNYYTYQVEAVGEYTNSQQAASPKLFSYTAPTAPTTVTVSPGEVVPGGAASLSFSGATAPGGVSIASYSIFQAASPTGTYAYVGTSTSNIWAFAAPSSNGHYYYRVQAIGSVSGYNSPQSAQYADLYVRKPKSTISIRQIRVPMDGVTAVTVDLGVNDVTYKHVLRWYSTDGVLRSEPLDIPAGITSAQITLSYAWNQYVPGESISAFADLTTMWGSTVIGTDSCAFTAFVPESEKPNATLSVTLNDAYMTYALSGYTTATLNLSATFPLGAVPSNTDAYKIWGGGFNGASAQTYTTVPLSVGSYTFYGQATDSRSHKGTDEKAVVVTSYDPPMISDVTCFRASAVTLQPDNDGSVIRIKAKFNVTSLEGNNTVAQATARYKQSGTGNWSDPVMLLSEQEITLAAGIAVDQTYDVEIQLKDTVGKSAVPHPASVPASTRLFDFRKDRAALGRLAPSDNDKVLALPNDWDILHKGQTLDERYAGVGHNHSGIYAPLSHTHVKTNITDFAHTHPLGELSGVTPAAIGAAPASHSQNASTVTAGTFPVGLFVFNAADSASGANTGQVNTLQVRQNVANADAFMSFHVSGDYAIHFGLDGSTNDLFCGGWSAGGNKYKIYHSGNTHSHSYLPLTGGVMSGAITGLGYGSGSIGSGGYDNATFTQHNLRIGSWYGIGFYDLCQNQCGIVMDTRNANIGINGKVISNNMYGLVIQPGSGEASIQYNNGTTMKWIVGKGTGGIGDTFGWWYNPYGYNAMTLDINGKLSTASIIQSNASGRYYQVGCQNTGYAHHFTNSDYGHWFDKDVRCQGEMYAGAGYDQRVFHTGNTMFGPNLPGASYVGQVFFKTS